MMHQPAFAVPCQLASYSRCRLSTPAKSGRRPFCMSAARPDVSRRQLGKLMLSTLAASAVVGLNTIPSIANAADKATKKPEFIKDESGILYYDTKVGSGASPVEGDFVIIDYLAFLSNGSIFDNRKGFVFQMGQRQVIDGLEAAVASMKPGGERKIVVPPALAYGNKGVCIAEKNECLVPPGERLGYDVTLRRVAIPPT